MVSSETALVLRIDAKVCHVEVGGQECAIPLRGRLFERRRRDLPVAVGDRVRLSAGRDAIEEVLPRDSQLSRARASADGREHVIAANVSLVMVTTAIAEPALQIDLVDRVLAAAEHHEIPPVLVITKVDLDPDGVAERHAAMYRSVGYRVLLTSVAEGHRTDDTLAEVRELLRANTTVLSGTSGVGKSSLINALCPDLDLRVGEMSRILQGRHTTTHTRLIALPGGGHVLDTPGIRGFELWSVDPQAVQFLFPELRPLIGACGYRNCLHLEEPGCAVRDAVEREDVHASRYASYRAMYDEVVAADADH